MSPWLTFVIGIIFGLLIGWVIDLLYRRRAAAQRELKPAPDPKPEWAQPLPDTPPVSSEGAIAAASAVLVAEDQVSPDIAERESAGVTQQVDWPEVSGRVAEVGAEAPEPGIAEVTDVLPESSAAGGLTQEQTDALAPDAGEASDITLEPKRTE